MDTVQPCEKGKGRKREINKENWKRRKMQIERHKPHDLPQYPKCAHNKKPVFLCRKLSMRDIQSFHMALYSNVNKLSFMGTCNEKTHTLFVDAFLQNNRLDHVSQVMGYHPSYLEKFLQTQNFILSRDGPLPFDYRHYIAIMAAGRHQCQYLINLQKQEFLQQGGDQNWLRGLKAIPQKLRNLYDINKILAHRPWLLRTSHIEKLTKCGKDSWSLAEVVHAIVILTHFHSLCSFVFSCGVNQELDQAGGYEYPGGQRSPTEKPGTAGPKGSKTGSPTGSRPGEWVDPLGGCPPSPTEPEVGITTLMQRMKTLSEQTEECTPVELAKRFENIEVQSAELGVIGPEPQETPADVSYFVDDASFQYQDFAKRTETDIHTFRVQDYSWDDHGYSTVNRLYNEVGTLLDSKFMTAKSLTYYTMGGRTDVDTSRFRRAIWNYIQALLGIRHDDYDYREIDELVDKPLKSFIKTACCYPERVTKKVYDRVMREFKHSEKVHVNLMVLESRMQAELIYALRTVNRYMTI
ncbi:sestrin homolog isoform X2 [Anthonomus grandis grandis]|uniref:sestrin homolog isoform X2 n=1 Tax=Anthonomus grandis grandis TaxID=2921223 RepID=UPI0021662206|nr:sestrin homolog isoform X2 [Anthonomus grandis grandis]